MRTPKISVIVPIYNVEPYLRRSIDSILAQEERDFELLLIDDGSTDGSGKICDEYEKKDERIKVFHKENGGVSSARNVGLDHANGEWIFFCDADDYISVDELTIPYPCENTDIIQKSFQSVSESVKGFDRKTLVDNEILSDDVSILNYFHKNDLKTGTVWGKMYRRSTLGNRRFDTRIKIGEDYLFNILLIRNIHEYMFCNVGMYYHVERMGSAMYSPKDADKVIIDELFDVTIPLIKNECGTSAVAVSIFVRRYFSWMLKNKYIWLLTDKQLNFIYHFLVSINSNNNILLSKKEMRLYKKEKYLINSFLKNKLIYRLYTLPEYIDDLVINLKFFIKPIFLKVLH